jgi:hypothetical protein
LSRGFGFGLLSVSGITFVAGGDRHGASWTADLKLAVVNLSPCAAADKLRQVQAVPYPRA